MSMVINTNMDSLHIQSAYNKNNIKLQSSMYKVSTGQKINSSGDDPSGLAMSERIRTRIDSVDRAKANLQSDTAIMKMADGALSNMSEIISSIREKVVAAGSSGVTSADRQNLKNDIDTLITRYDEIVKDAKYGGYSFFDTAAATSYTTTNSGFRVQYGADSGNNFELTFAKLDAKTVGLTASKIGNNISAAVIKTSAIDTALNNIDSALNNVLKQQASIGTYEQRLGYLSDNRTNESLALKELDSTIRDTDMAQGMSEFMKYNILTQASQLMLAQAGQNPSMVLRLLE